MTNSQHKRRSDSTSHIPETAGCLECGYALRGLPEPVCPECGRGFDPSDPWSFRDAAKRGFGVRLIGPPGRWHRRIVVALTATLLCDVSSPGYFFGITCLYPPLALIVLLVITIQYVIRLATTLYNQPAGRGSQRKRAQNQVHRRQWLVTPVCLLLVASLLAYPWPTWIRFQVSRPAFERIVRGGKTTNKPELVGVYLVRSIESYQNGTVFLETGDSGLFGASGFMYLPPNATYQSPHPETRLAHSWYIAAYDWFPAQH